MPSWPTFAFDASGLAGAAAPAVEHPAAVAVSLLIACIASYVALDLAGRVRTIDFLSNRLWIVAGAVVLGTGVWAMHFMGMSAGRFPFSPRVQNGTTLLSWALAIAAAAVPVALASCTSARRRTWAWIGAAGTSLGVAVMHGVGMEAMETLPGPVLSVGPLLLAAVVATVCTRAAVAVFAAARASGRDGILAQAAAAALLGGGLTVLHYIAMAAAAYAPGTICSAYAGLEVGAFGGTIGAVTLAFLGLMMLVSWLERRSYRMALRLNSSLGEAKAELEYVTFTDAVTGLPNRLVFQDRLGQALERQRQDGGKVAVLLLEPDRFADETRHLGAHDVDALRQAIAERLMRAAGPGWAVSSAGGQQFLLLASGPQVDADAAVAAFHRSAEALDIPLDTPAGVLRVRTSGGITIFPDDGQSDRVTSNAGAALERVQSRGGGSFAFFEPTMDSDARQRAVHLAALRQAVAAGQLELHYQPKVHAASGLIAGTEALLRWRHPELGSVSPAVFIPLAERFGLIDELGSWVLEQACRQMAEWRGRGIRMRVAVNVSVGQLSQPDFPARVAGLLETYGIDAGQLTCEVTESGAMEDIATTRPVFDALQRSGVRLSIDDFGTGYSSLSYLRQLPISQLKIDRSFVSDLERDADARAVVGSIVQLAQALRLEVVAEGVETAAQRDILLDLRCDKFQGYLFARPMPASDLTELLATRDEPRRFRESLFAATV